MSPVFRLGPPAGLDTMKLMATNKPLDYTSSLQPEISRGDGMKGRGMNSPLGMIFEQQVNTRDGYRDTEFDMDEWTTENFDFIVSP